MSEKSFHFNWPKPRLASRLAKKAVEHCANGEYATALRLIERAMTHDQNANLLTFCKTRAAISTKLGNFCPHIALELFNTAFKSSMCGQYYEAKQAYLESFAIDPVFLWPANNYAWILASSCDDLHYNAQRALEISVSVCRQSNWSCWSFIDTLAAAYAEVEDFANAIGWQRVANKLAPKDSKDETNRRLISYTRGVGLRMLLTTCLICKKARKLNKSNFDACSCVARSIFAHKSIRTDISCRNHESISITCISACVASYLRYSSTLRFEKLLTVIDSVYFSIFDTLPSDGVRIAIENAVIEMRLEEFGDSPLSCTYTDSPFFSFFRNDIFGYLAEDTSPRQENAIRALEDIGSYASTCPSS